MIQREWNDSLGSADVSWGGVRAITTAAKETMVGYGSICKLISEINCSSIRHGKEYNIN